MNSRAMGDRAGRIKFPLQEPAPSKRKSQIDDYLSYYQGPGAQHIAVLTGDIVASVRALQANGIEFRSTPATYYDMLEARVGPIDADLAALRELSILVDRDQWGYLMQIFCKPMQGRPTMFCELIQREGARGFGSGNIKALFQSVEREQLLRGSL
jgi:4-hydroxyphenylpyruvate dioxygenase